MNRFRSMTAGALVAGLLVAGVASAQGPRGGGPGGPGRGPGGRGGGPVLALGALNLTEAQGQQIRDIRTQKREGMRRLEERMRQAAAAQRAAIETVPVNEGLIRQTSDVLADVQAEAAIQQAHVYNQIWTVLTPAQQAQAATLRAERAARENQMRAERQQNRPGRQ